ncbi:type I polyketide synthase [Streptomyces sp. TP-A0356]|uniref:type I polyketide synthase n=1 Tax=Streptomyces sp. TP-A0356 TaxID=1359208 RepID=UPI0006E1B362|nr:type I polyketide synthase [Streptomyces sp. TP-A0356]
MSKYAIVGLSCLFPDARTPAEFWQNLRSGADARREGGDEIFGATPEDADLDPQHRIYCRRGGFITDFAFDPTGYRLDPEQLARLDRIFHWSLYTAREALRDSGYEAQPETLARTALVLGNYSFPTPTSARISIPLAREAVLEGLRQAGLPALAGLPPGAPLVDADLLRSENLRVSGSPAAVTAAALGLGGPRYALDAACSSALYALKLACAHLAAGQADLVLAGGVCAPDPTLIHLSFSDLRAYPESGFSQPFDNRSEGILTGQGAGVVAVKRLADALWDGDRIHAVIDGIGLSNDGSGRHLLVPQAGGQLASYELAYAEAGVDPSAIDYLECHATGTPLGDATEAESVAAFFGRHGKVPLIGSVKGNVGHLLTVAGLSSLLKVVLAMNEGHIPPTIGVEQPVCSSDGRVGEDVLVREGRPWPEGVGPLRAAVSAFGFGGTNAHVVLSAPEAAETWEPVEEPPAELPALDIVGLGAHFGPLDGVDALERAVHAGADAFGPLPERRWRGLEQTGGGTLDRAGLAGESVPRGAYVDGVDIDPVDHKIPPADLRTYNLQHALATQVADEALRDAGYSRAIPPGASAPEPRRIAVVVAMELEPYTHARLTRYTLGSFLREQFEAAGVELTEQQLAEVAAVGRDAVVPPIVANEVLSYIGNVMASRISSLWNLTGPSFTVSSEGSGTAEALEVARLLLLDPGVEAVLVGAVDLTGSAEHLLLHPDAVSEAGLTFAEGARGVRIGEGAGAVVVTRGGESEGRRVYARLDSLALRTTRTRDGAAPQADTDTLAATAEAALAAAGISAAEVGYVEAHAAGTEPEDDTELTALARVYRPAGQAEPSTAAEDAPEDGPTAAAAGAVAASRQGLAEGAAAPPDAAAPERGERPVRASGDTPDPFGDAPAPGSPVDHTRTVALGSAKAQLGNAGCASGMAGLIRTVLCLHHGYLPGTAGWQRPAAEFVEGFATSALYVPERSQPWLRSSRRARRHAAVSMLGSHGACAHLVLSADGTRGRAVAADWERAEGPILLALSAASLDGLLASVERHRGLLHGGADPLTLARAAARELPGTSLRAVLVGRNAADLRLQLELAARDIPGAHAAGGEWATPAGSYFTACPIGPEGKVALVYPGAFNSYPGLGQDLFRAFPGLLEHFEAQAEEPARQLRSALLHPRTFVTPGRRELMELESALGEDVPFMLATGTSFAILYTHLVREILGVTAHGGLGYSLGESSMLFATNGWLAEGRRDDLISTTPIFRDRLVGPRRTVRELWQDIPAGTPDKDLWASHVLLTDQRTAQAALARYDRVFLTHVNTPGELVIAGDPAQCRALIEELGCPAARSPVGVVMHCPVVDAELDGLAGLNDYPTGSIGGLELFSAYDYQQLPGLDRKRIARRIAHTLRSTIDFPRLIRTAYDHGYRYFLEVGPGATCSRWVRETLVEQAHVAVCVDRRGVPATRSIAQMAARLVGHGLPVDLAALLGAEADAEAPVPARRTARFRVGGGDPLPERVARGVRVIAPAVSLLTAHQPAAQPVATPATVPAASASGPASGPVPAPASAPVPSTAPEEPDPMPADPTVADPEAIGFDGDPIAFLPWAPASPEQPATAASVLPYVPTAPTAPDAPAHANGTGVPAADLVRELRRQMIATHSVVMETQRVLQDGTLSRAEALLVGEPISPQASPAVPLQGEPAPLPPAASAPEPVPLPPAPAPAPARPATTEAPENAPLEGVIWDEAALLEFATGSVAKVFGPEFAPIDAYARRVRLPAPPYHFVTRVTRLDARTGTFGPATITTEYDIPEDAWYLVDEGAPPAVTVEAGQCDLLLVSYLGIDFRNKGERVYRLLDSSLIFRGGLPRAGQTLRYDISIDRFVHNGDTTLFFFSYNCYADGELILELRDACAGFFSRQELDSSLGVVITDRERAERAALTKGYFKPLARTGKTLLTTADLELLAQGRHGEVFGPEHAQDEALNPALRLPDAMLRMVDEVTVDRLGGPRGLGKLSAVKHLEPDAWYFTCHFPDDPVLAGSLVAEGAVQLLQIYLLYLGMHLTLPDARFQTVTDERIDVQVRGQVTPEHREIRYEVEIMEVTLLPRPTVMADILVYLGDKPVIKMRNLGLQVREKDGTPYRPETGGVPAFLGRRNRSGEPAMINELHLAHAAKGLLDMAMGPEFEIYRGSRAPYIPNGDFQFVDRVMSLKGTRGDLGPGSEMVTEYDSPADAWYYRQNSHPHMPNCVYMETSLQAAIFLGYYLGATLKEPQQQYSIRNLDGRATLVKDVDLRGKTIRHHSKLLMTSAVSGAVLQNFSYELSADGEVFYTGESLFGYFSEAALANQVGLDNGSYVAPWIEQEPPAAERVRRIELTEDAPAFTDPAAGHLHLPGENFHLVDHVDLVADGGRHGAGYLHGCRQVRPDEWYFDCHFHRDPVMPGSLGVEAVLQAMRLFVLEQGLAEGIGNPRFAMATGVEMSWKYRGQILRNDGELRFDVHIKEVRREADRLLLIADADLWKPGLRIYELTDAAIEVRSAPAHA